MSPGVLLGLGVGLAFAEDPAPAPPAPPADAPPAPPADAPPAPPVDAPPAPPADPPAAPPATPPADPPATPPATVAVPEAPVVPAPPTPTSPPPPPADDGDDLWSMLENMPPHRSWDLAVGINYTDVTYWRSYTAPWLGLGVRAAYGSHVGASRKGRLGASAMFSFEGPVPQYYSLAFEPSADWDYVNKGVQVGASIGPAVYLHRQMTLMGSESFVTASPWVGVRVGWSQPWSRIMRRMFLVADPKLRIIAGLPSWSVGIAIGSGTGR